MGKKKSNVQPISSALDAVVADFRKHMKATDVKLKEQTYDQVLELMADHCQQVLAEHAHQVRIDQA